MAEGGSGKQSPARQALLGLLRLGIVAAERGVQAIRSSGQTLREIYDEAVEEHNADRASVRQVGPVTAAEEPPTDAEAAPAAGASAAAPGTGEATAGGAGTLSGPSTASPGLIVPVVPGSAPAGSPPVIVVAGAGQVGVDDAPTSRKRGRPRKSDAAGAEASAGEAPSVGATGVQSSVEVGGRGRRRASGVSARPAAGEAITEGGLVVAAGSDAASPRKRGRPRKLEAAAPTPEPARRGRSRTSTAAAAAEPDAESPRRSRGRPRKQPLESASPDPAAEVILPGSPEFVAASAAVGTPGGSVDAPAEPALPPDSAVNVEGPGVLELGASGDAAS